MTRKSTKNSDTKIAVPRQVIDEVSIEHADEILKKLASEDAKISQRIEELALEYLTGVDPDEIAEYVFCDLDSLDVEDVWKNSGRTRYGYIDPYELASEMFEEVLKPYVDKLRRCQKISLDEEAKLHCMGILQGIDMFEREATTEFQDWAVDDPHENFIQIYKGWRKENRNPENVKEMDGFIKKNFPKWYSDVFKA